MIDYVNTEIVAYADDIITVSYAGQDYQFNKGSYFIDKIDNDFVYVSALNSGTKFTGLAFGIRSVDSGYSSTIDLTDYFNSIYKEAGIHYVVSQTLVECYVGEYGSTRGSGINNPVIVDRNETSSIYGTATYVRFTALNAVGTIKYNGYFRVPNEYIPSIYIPPLIGNLAIDGSDIFLLYNLGRTLIYDNPVFSLLNTEIGGMSFLTILFSSGFMIYVLWVVVKWIIPT